MISELRSEFIGRRHELESLASMLHTSRLVTLTGVGGSGKTRLASFTLTISAARVKSFHLAGEPELALNNAGRGFAHIPVTVTAS